MQSSVGPGREGCAYRKRLKSAGRLGFLEAWQFKPIHLRLSCLRHLDFIIQILLPNSFCHFTLRIFAASVSQKAQVTLYSFLSANTTFSAPLVAVQRCIEHWTFVVALDQVSLS